MDNKNQKSTAKKKTTAKKKSTKKSGVGKTVKKRKVEKHPVKKKAASKKPSITQKKSGEDVKSKPNRAEEVDQALVLSSVLGTNNAKGLYSRFSNALSLKKDISIDASAVKMVDTAILQLLVSFVKKVESQKLRVIWVSPSDDFNSRANSLNLAEALGLNGAGD